MASLNSHSDLQLYFRQINGVPLLTADEEKQLGWRVINDNDDEAKQRMIKANLRLVIAISKHYANRGVPLADLIEEGNLGLIRAVDGFDPAVGTRFSTYAAWWIRQAIKRTLLGASQPIHVPAYMVELVGRLRECTRSLESRLHRPPTGQELANEMGLSMRKLAAIRRALKAFRVVSGRPRNADGEQSEFGETIADTRSAPPEEAIVREEQLRLVLRMLETIDDRDARVLRLRFGLEGQAPLTLKEIGREVGLTRERVRQIEVETLRRLQQQLEDDAPTRFCGEGASRSRRRRRGGGGADDASPRAKAG